MKTSQIALVPSSELTAKTLECGTTMRTLRSQEPGGRKILIKKELGGPSQAIHTLSLSIFQKRMNQKRMKQMYMFKRLRVKTVATLKSLDTGSTVLKV
jgi:hypothetical protein